MLRIFSYSYSQRSDNDNNQIQFKILDTIVDKDLTIKIAKISIIHNSSRTLMQ